MTPYDALLLAKERGWSPGVWANNVDEGRPEVAHPFDYLSEGEVESVASGDLYTAALRLEQENDADPKTSLDEVSLNDYVEGLIDIAAQGNAGTADDHAREIIYIINRTIQDGGSFDGLRVVPA